MKLNIFSYNIHGLPFLPDKWSEPLADWFHKTDYDFVCLQEVFTPGRVDNLTNGLVKNGYTVFKPNDFAKRKNLLSSGLITAISNARWTLLSEGFETYETCAGAEHLANKGFHWLLLKHKLTGENFIIVNTHLQADHPFNYFAGCMDTRPIRRAQVEQILKQLHEMPKYRSLIIGDINSNHEPHDEMTYFTGTKNGFRKHTFEDGEDLDHVAFIPALWRNFNVPQVKSVAVLSNLWWSDHWPIHVILDCETSAKK
jgi:exonuclease III